jgi:hypothetical protein
VSIDIERELFRMFQLKSSPLAYRFELALLLPPPSSHPVNLLPLPEPSRGLKDHPPVHISDKAYLHTAEAPADLEPPRPPFLQVQTPSSPGEVAETPDSQSSGDSAQTRAFD